MPLRWIKFPEAVIQLSETALALRAILRWC
jgi:hypothetical protein